MCIRDSSDSLYVKLGSEYLSAESQPNNPFVLYTGSSDNKKLCVLPSIQTSVCLLYTSLYDAKLSQDMAAKLLDEGIYVTGFYYPVVPKDLARIRVQISAAVSYTHLDVYKRQLL